MRLFLAKSAAHFLLPYLSLIVMTESMRPEFWKNYQLNELNQSEWEALCDGCGMCCLIKLEDDETNEVAYTKVACKLLDCQTAQCSDYPNRFDFVPDCIQLTPEKLETIQWLPSSCAYRRVKEGKNLPNWHHLITGSRESILKARKSAAGRCVSELVVEDDEIEDFIVRWVR